MKHVILIIVHLCISLVWVKAQQQGILTVCGSWEGYQLPDVGKVDENLPAIEVYEKHIIPDAINYHKSYSLEIKQDSFYTTVPITKSHQYIRIANVGKTRGERLSFGSLFLVRPGDSIHIDIYEDKPLAFSSSNKLIELQFQLAMLGRKPLVKSLSRQVEEDLHSGLSEIEKRLNIACQLWESYSNDVDNDMLLLCQQNFRYQLLSTLCQRLYNDVYFGDVSLLYPELIEKVSSAFKLYQQVPDKHFIDQTVSYLSFQYYLHLTLGTMQAIIDGTGRGDYLQLAEFTYRSILQIPDVYVRDRTLNLFFKRSNDFYKSGQSGVPLLKEAISVTRDLDAKQELEQRLVSLSGGQKTPDFSFFDQQGNAVSLSEFRGKVVVAHFWFLGCVPCIKLTKAFEPLVKSYGDHSEIVFLNINVDREQKKWKSGLQSGNYHHPQEKLLHTGISGMSHPMLRYFEFFSVPELVVIGKDGSVVSKRPEGHGSNGEITALDRILTRLIN